MSEVYFDKQYHEFGASGNPTPAAIAATLDRPISIIVQVTRRCSLNCAFCSESEQFTDPSFETLDQLRSKLAGVQRVYLSGGEPLLRSDIFRIIRAYRPDFPILGLPTNCVTVTPAVCDELRGLIDYINAGLDGPRAVNDAIRGSYDAIVEGLRCLRQAGIEVSLSTVILKATLPYLEHVVQTADCLGVRKVKMVVPVLRGRAAKLQAREFADSDQILRKFEELCQLKKVLGWRPRLKFAFWTSKTQGYALLVYPDQRVHAWPVPSAPDGVEYIGDLATESISQIWAKYRYKENHVGKYIGSSMFKG